jgi:hypothetical protein
MLTSFVFKKTVYTIGENEKVFFKCLLHFDFVVLVPALLTITPMPQQPTIIKHRKHTLVVIIIKNSSLTISRVDISEKKTSSIHLIAPSIIYIMPGNIPHKPELL